MRTLALFLILAFASAARTSRDDFEDRVWSQQNKWEAFFRGYMGCPAAPKPEPGQAVVGWITCHQAAVRIDRPAFSEACEAAKRLWELSGNCR